MEPITSQRALEISKNANEAKDIYFEVYNWVNMMIEDNAENGFLATRLNIKDKVSVFNKEFVYSWSKEILDWNYIIKKLETDLRDRGFKIQRTDITDFHILF